MLARASLHAVAHGFVPARSIVSNALPHVGQAVVVNLDLKDFSPLINMPRIKGVFPTLGYSEQIATILALLCTEAPPKKSASMVNGFLSPPVPAHYRKAHRAVRR